MKVVFVLISYMMISIVALAQSDFIRINQIGFYPEGPKKAVIVDVVANSFELLDTDGQVVYSGSVKNKGVWSSSGENVRLVDFSDFKQTGDFILNIPNVGQHPFTINYTFLKEPMKEISRYFYYNRASMEIAATYAGSYARPKGHSDNVVRIHSSAATTTRPAGTIINASGGWYDAGDFGKYMSTAGISVYTLMSSYEQYPDYHANLDLNIPESSNNVPDILDEAKYELDWMLKMQDPNDGGVYHKLATLGWAGNVMPHEENAARYVCGKSTQSTLEFAAALAHASIVFKAFETEFPGFSNTCKLAAIAAWDWAKDNPTEYAGTTCGSMNDVGSGSYGDSNTSQEWAWAAAELYLATGTMSYYNDQRNNIRFNGFNAPTWTDERAMASVSLLVHQDKLTGNALSDLIAIENNLLNTVDDYVDYASQSSPYEMVMGVNPWEFNWGSNGYVGNQGWLLLTAYNLFEDKDYLEAAITNVDYLLGRNATAYSFITGFGTKKVLNPHHRASKADGISTPLPGMVLGGPHSNIVGDCAESSYPSIYTAKRYVDDYCSYSTNEVTINWNAPAAFLFHGIDAYYGKVCQAPILEDTISLCGFTAFPYQIDVAISTGDFAWYKDGILQSNTTSIYAINDVASAVGKYKVVRDSATCIRTDSVFITTDFPDLGLVDTIQQQVEGEQVILSTSINAFNEIYAWYKNDELIDDETSNQLIVNDCDVNYSLGVDAGSCATIYDTTHVACYRNVIKTITLDSTSCGASIKWTVDKTEPIKSYQLYKSINGGVYSKVSGANFAAGISSFSYCDYVKGGNASYKVVALFENGNQETSPIVSQYFQFDSDVIQTIGRNKMTIYINDNTPSTYKIKVFDRIGNLMWTAEQVSGSINTLETDLAQGVYFVEIDTGDDKKVHKVIL